VESNEQLDEKDVEILRLKALIAAMARSASTGDSFTGRKGAIKDILNLSAQVEEAA